jgi:hypothetical protein
MVAPNERTDLPLSLDSFVDIQDVALRSFRTECADIWESFRRIDRAFQALIPSSGIADRCVATLLWLADDAWRSFLNTAACCARLQPSEPFMFIRRAADAALYAAKLASHGLRTPEFKSARKLWLRRHKDWKSFRAHFDGRDQYRHLGKACLLLYDIRGKASDFGPHAGANSLALHLIPDGDAAMTSPFLATSERARRNAIHAAGSFLYVLDVLVPTMKQTGMPADDADELLGRAKRSVTSLPEAMNCCGDAQDAEAIDEESGV